MSKNYLSLFVGFAMAATGCMGVEADETATEDLATAEELTTEDVADVTETKAVALANSVELVSFTSTCAGQSTPRLVFFGRDAAGRESYTVQNVSSTAGSPGGCQYSLSLRFAPGKKGRISGAFLRGFAFGSRSTTVRHSFRPQFRTAFGSEVAQTFNLNQSTQSFQQFFPISQGFNQCSRAGSAPETMFISSSVSATGGLPGFPPNGSITLNAAEVSFQVESC